jgi:hypothetical protein
VVPLVASGAFLNWSGLPSAYLPFSSAIFSAPLGLPYASNFYASNQFTFSATVGGASGSATWNRLSTDPATAVVDGSFAGGGFGP